MQKKGISPLIATVLLIGFTVALAAIIIVWAGDYFRVITGKADCETKTQLACTEVNYAITNLTCYIAGEAKITINNKGNRQIESFTLRQYQDDIVTVNNNIKAGDNGDEVLEPFGVDFFIVSDLTPGEEITKVEAIPEIKVEDCEPKFCAQIIKETSDGCIVT